MSNENGCQVVRLLVTCHTQVRHCTRKWERLESYFTTLEAVKDTL